MRPSFDNEGDRLLRPFGREVVTDDRGEYRIYLVTPGRYYVNAGTPQGPPGSGDPRLGPNQAPVFYTSKFYPGATDIQFANELEVRPGAEVRGIDFTLDRQAGVSVSGRILNASTGPGQDDVDIDLEYRDPGTGWDYGLDYRGRSEAIYENGRFEFQNVLPGLYTLTAAVDDPAAPEGIDLKRLGYMPVEVAEADLEDLALTVHPGGTIFGRVTTEGRDSLEDGFIRDTPLGVRLEPSRNGGRPSIPGLPAPTYGELSPDGTFRIDNIMPGEYRLAVNWLRENFYVKAALFGTTDLRTGLLEFTGRETATLEILVSPNVASVEGAVTDDGLNAVEGAQVVLVPDVARHRPELFKAVRTDQRGRFTIPDIAPGDYKLYAWEAIEPYGWFDLELADRYAAEAVSLSLGESDRRQISTTVIPLPVR